MHSYLWRSRSDTKPGNYIGMVHFWINAQLQENTK